MIKKFICTFLVFIITNQLAFAQNELLNELLANDSLSKQPREELLFKNGRIINQQSVEGTPKGFLEVKIAHRFGAIGTSSNGTSSYHNLWGFDASSDIRLSVEYGIVQHLTIGFARSKQKENWELFGKYKLLTQKKNGGSPISIALYGATCYSSREDNRLVFDLPTSQTEFIRRLAYCTQLIVARKWSKRIALQAGAGIVHRNFVDVNESNLLPFLTFAGKIKITKTLNLLGDYVYHLDESRKINNNLKKYNPLGLGLELDTGGHIFSFMFTNAAAITETEYISNTMDTWTKGGVRFSFNITRSFDLTKKNH